MTIRNAMGVGLLLTCAVLAFIGVQHTAHADEPIRFDRDIHPILSENCFACHGPDADKREADLRLDSLEEATRDLGGQVAIVPGNSQASHLIERILSTDPDIQMPPAKSNKNLSLEQRNLLRQWIDQGAHYEGHWSYEPLSRPSVPQITGAAHPVDAFVRERLIAEGIDPAPRADDITLYRRLAMDLIGLPPAPSEIDAFLADTASDKWEQYIDRLLSSPHFGERMAVWWLDLVRYGDSVGYHGDQEITMWPYRDWVIEAFNSNMPFDTFTQQQLGGDLIEHASLNHKVAASFNRLNMMSAEGGGQDKEYRAKYASDRVRATSGVWLGSTLGCAECHDHKFDPFTSRDFYSFAAFFDDVQERGIYGGSHANGMWGEMMRVPSPQQAVQQIELNRTLDEANQQYKSDSPELLAARQLWLGSIGTLAAWSPLEPIAASGGSGTLAIQTDRSILASGPTDDTAQYTIALKLPVGTLTGMRLVAMPHDSLPKKGAGRAGNGNFVITEISGVVRRIASEQNAVVDSKPMVFLAARSNFEQTFAGNLVPAGKWSAALTIDRDENTKTFGWGVLERADKLNELVLEFSEALVVEPDCEVFLTISQLHGTGHLLGHFRIDATSSMPTILPDPSDLPAAVREILVVSKEARTEKQNAAISEYHRSIAPEWASFREQQGVAQQALTALIESQPNMAVTVSGQRRITRILPRGNWMDDSGDIVHPATPQFLSKSIPDDLSSDSPHKVLTRLDLARWLTSPDNPLVSRVLANRLFAISFGNGLSTRLDDHGSQGQWPSHPQLLDFLACELRDQGWDIKRFLRLLMTSDAYCRDSQPSAHHVQRDPENRLLARQSRWRIDAESIRDTALVASGLLVRTIGGASVKPYQPEGFWDYLNFPKRIYKADTGDSLYRRGLYVHWQRQYLHPAMSVFDAPSREECTARRPRSNTPLQALVLLNDPEFVEAAKALAMKTLLSNNRSPTERADFMLRQAIGRPPHATEIAVLVDMVDRHRATLSNDHNAVTSLLAIGTGSMPPKEIDPVELTAWMSAARAVLNLHETYSRN